MMDPEIDQVISRVEQTLQKFRIITSSLQEHDSHVNDSQESGRDRRSLVVDEEWTCNEFIRKG